MRSKSEPPVQDEPTFIEAARRSQIVECAIDAIAELGYERASLAEIAKRARVSKSVISYYFAGKDELIEQVVNAVYALAAEDMVPQIKRETTGAGALRTYITSNIEFIGARRKQVQALVEISSSFRDADGRPRFDMSKPEEATSDVRGILLWGQQSGEFRAFSSTVMAHAVRAAIDALPPRLGVEPGIDLEKYATELADLFDIATRVQS